MATKADAEKFDRDGYLVIENFIDENEVEEMKKECRKLVDDMDPKDHHTVFSTEKQTYRDNYFINSADKIGYFFEDKALDDNGTLQVPKEQSLNKIGHAMHVLCPAFRKFTFSNNMKNIVKNLGLEDPVVVQSMYIFKQAKIGGAVTSHQDGTYLYTEPMKKVIGFWVALEDTTVENGCLWFAPGTHKDGLIGNHRMIRNPEKSGPSCIHIGEKPEYEAEYVPVPIKKGSLIVIHGLVYHKSEKNLSEKSRNIYTFHIYDASCTQWNSQNWLQPTPANVFTHMNDVTV